MLLMPRGAITWAYIDAAGSGDTALMTPIAWLAWGCRPLAMHDASSGSCIAHAPHADILFVVGAIFTRVIGRRRAARAFGKYHTPR